MATDLTLVPYDFDSLKADLINEISTYPEWSDVSVDDTILQMIAHMLAYETTMILSNINKTYKDYFPNLTGSEDVITLFTNFIGMKTNHKLSASGQVTFTLSVPATQSIPIGSGVEVSNGGDIIFTTYPTDQSSIPVGGTTVTVDVIQGQYKTVNYVSSAAPSQTFFVNQPNIDDVHVTVKTSDSSTEYTRVTDFLLSTRTSTDYILNYTSTGFYIKFGDGINGVIPASGATIQLMFLVTLGDGGNIYSSGILTTLNTALNLPTGQSISVTNNNSLVGGYDGDDVNTIKANIPRYFTSTPYVYRREDYKAYLLTYPNLLDCNVFAGREISTDTTNWFTVYIYTVPKTGTTIDFADLLNYLKLKELFFSNISINNSVYISVSNTLNLTLNSASYSNNMITGFINQAKTIINSFYDYETVVATSGTIYRDIYGSQIIQQIMDTIPEILKMDVYLQTVDMLYDAGQIPQYVISHSLIYTGVTINYNNLDFLNGTSTGIYLYIGDVLVGNYTFVGGSPNKYVLNVTNSTYTGLLPQSNNYINTSGGLLVTFTQDPTTITQPSGVTDILGKPINIRINSFNNFDLLKLTPNMVFNLYSTTVNII